MILLGVKVKIRSRIHSRETYVNVNKTYSKVRIIVRSTFTLVQYNSRGFKCPLRRIDIRTGTQVIPHYHDGK